MTEKRKPNVIWQLFAVFFKIGLFTFGGGYAMISLIERETTSKGWATTSDILDMVALAESTPGVIAVNSATFIGNKVAKFWGALWATIGVVLPSFVIISTVYFILNAFMSNAYVAYAFAGIRACVPVLILNAVLKISKSVEKNVLSVTISVCCFALALFTDISEILILIVCALTGVIYTLIEKSVREKKIREFDNSENPVNTEYSDDSTESDANKSESGSQNKSEGGR